MLQIYKQYDGLSTLTYMLLSRLCTEIVCVLNFSIAFSSISLYDSLLCSLA